MSNQEFLLHLLIVSRIIIVRQRANIPIVRMSFLLHGFKSCSGGSISSADLAYFGSSLKTLSLCPLRRKGWAREPGDLERWNCCGSREAIRAGALRDDTDCWGVFIGPSGKRTSSKTSVIATKAEQSYRVQVERPWSKVRRLYFNLGPSLRRRADFWEGLSRPDLGHTAMWLCPCPK